MIDPPLFPAGEYSASEFTLPDATSIDRFEKIASRIQESVSDLAGEQLEVPYRNWSIRQIIHHLADSHLNCYIRIHWALTEETPEIKSYDETAWSELLKERCVPLDGSNALLEGVHRRLADLFRTLSESDFSKEYLHPEYQKTFSVAELIPLYTWHTEHHLAQIAWIRQNRISKAN